MKERKLPVLRDWLVDGFLWYSRGLLRRKFHTLAIDRQEVDFQCFIDHPLIVIANHPGWWDPLVAAILREELFPTRRLYAPIDASALQKYRILEQLGFYGIELESHSGAERFLSISKTILESPNTSIWLTPEGRFCDPRDRSADLMAGVSHLASRIRGIRVLPLAVEYSFWEESQPEILCRLGPPVFQDGEASWTKGEWHQRLTSALRQTQDALAEQVIQRKTDRFEILLASREKTQTWYDFFRKWSGVVRGRKGTLRHGTKFNESRATHR